MERFRFKDDIVSKVIEKFEKEGRVTTLPQSFDDKLTEEFRKIKENEPKNIRKI
jgi:chorismate-pyruvate lyase